MFRYQDYSKDITCDHCKHRIAGEGLRLFQFYPDGLAVPDDRIPGNNFCPYVKEQCQHTQYQVGKLKNAVFALTSRTIYIRVFTTCFDYRQGGNTNTHSQQ